MQCSQCQKDIQGKPYWKKFCRECAIETAAHAHHHEWLILTNNAWANIERRQTLLNSIA